MRKPTQIVLLNHSNSERISHLLEQFGDVVPTIEGANVVKVDRGVSQTRGEILTEFVVAASSAIAAAMVYDALKLLAQRLFGPQSKSDPITINGVVVILDGSEKEYGRTKRSKKSRTPLRRR